MLKFGAKITGSGLEKEVPKADLAKRDSLFKELKAKCAGSNFKLSPTRLILKNLPAHMDEKLLIQALWKRFM